MAPLLRTVLFFLVAVVARSGAKDMAAATHNSRKTSTFTLESVYAEMTVKEVRPAVASTVKLLGVPDASEEIELVFRAQESNTEQLEQLALDVSNPASPNYGKYLTKEQIDALTANPEAVVKIRAFLDALAAGGVTYDVVDDATIKARGPVATWEVALDTTFSRYATGTASDNVIVRADKYSLPTAVAPFVAAVFNTVQFPVALRSGPVVSALNEVGGSTATTAQAHHHHVHAATKEGDK